VNQLAEWISETLGFQQAEVRTLIFQGPERLSIFWPGRDF
jgi:hypothetical protein